MTTQRTVTMNVNMFYERVLDSMGYPQANLDELDPKMEAELRRNIKSAFDNTLDDELLIYRTGEDIKREFGV